MAFFGSAMTTLHASSHPLLNPFNLLSHADVHIVSEDGVTFATNKLLLSTASMTLKVILLEASAEDVMPVIKMECHSSAVQACLDFLATGLLPDGAMNHLELVEALWALGIDLSCLDMDRIVQTEPYCMDFSAEKVEIVVKVPETKGNVDEDFEWPNYFDGSVTKVPPEEQEVDEVSDNNDVTGEDFEADFEAVPSPSPEEEEPKPQKRRVGRPKNADLKPKKIRRTFKAVKLEQPDPDVPLRRSGRATAGVNASKCSILLERLPDDPEQWHELLEKAKDPLAALPPPLPKKPRQKQVKKELGESGEDSQDSADNDPDFEVNGDHLSYDADGDTKFATKAKHKKRDRACFGMAKEDWEAMIFRKRAKQRRFCKKKWTKQQWAERQERIARGDIPSDEEEVKEVNNDEICRIIWMSRLKGQNMVYCCEYPKSRAMKRSQRGPRPIKFVTEGERDETKKFQCDQCLFGTDQITPFKEHMHKHTVADKPEEQYICTLCKITFPSHDAKNKHIKNGHDGLKSMKCRYCDMTFYAKTDRKKRRQHEWEVHRYRERQCGECGKVFKHRDSVAKHRTQMGIMHDGKCAHPGCSEVFGTGMYEDYQKHIKEAHNDIWLYR